MDDARYSCLNLPSIFFARQSQTCRAFAVHSLLSPGTAKNDKGYKKDLYEKSGVKEYWIIDPVPRSIEVYLLTDGKFALDEVYALYPEGLSVTDKEREETKKEIQVSLYNDFCISLEEIFRDLF